MFILDYKLEQLKENYNENNRNGNDGYVQLWLRSNASYYDSYKMGV